MLKVTERHSASCIYWNYLGKLLRTTCHVAHCYLLCSVPRKQGFLELIHTDFNLDIRFTRDLLDLLDYQWVIIINASASSIKIQRAVL